MEPANLRRLPDDVQRGRRSSMHWSPRPPSSTASPSSRRTTTSTGSPRGPSSARRAPRL